MAAREAVVGCESHARALPIKKERLIAAQSQLSRAPLVEDKDLQSTVASVLLKYARPENFWRLKYLCW